MIHIYKNRNSAAAAAVRLTGALERTHFVHECLRTGKLLLRPDELPSYTPKDYLYVVGPEKRIQNFKLGDYEYVTLSWFRVSKERE